MLLLHVLLWCACSWLVGCGGVTPQRQRLAAAASVGSNGEHGHQRLCNATADDEASRAAERQQVARQCWITLFHL